MKEIELLLMSTEDEIRGQPSLPVSSACVCNFNACALDTGFKDSGSMCVRVCACARVYVRANKEEETSGGSVSAKSDETGPYRRLCGCA